MWSQPWYFKGCEVHISSLFSFILFASEDEELKSGGSDMVMNFLSNVYFESRGYGELYSNVVESWNTHILKFSPLPITSWKILHVKIVEIWMIPLCTCCIVCDEYCKETTFLHWRVFFTFHLIECYSHPIYPFVSHAQVDDGTCLGSQTSVSENGS